MLVLFDIDGTLLRSMSAGIHAMTSALQELHGTTPDFSRVPVHGRLDTLIWRDLAGIHGFAADDAAHAAFRATYARHLERRLAERNTVERYPGAAELVDAAAALPGASIGLLTGNYEPTGRLKVRHAGIDPDRFTVNAWGDEGPDRRSLVPVALGRYRSLHGRSLPAAEAVIVGDTPFDVDCAHAAGARCVAVATGAFGLEELRAAGADLAVPSLEDTDAIVRWMLRRP